MENIAREVEIGIVRDTDALDWFIQQTLEELEKGNLRRYFKVTERRGGVINFLNGIYVRANIPAGVLGEKERKDTYHFYPGLEDDQLVIYERAKSDLAKFVSNIVSDEYESTE